MIFRRGKKAKDADGGAAAEATVDAEPTTEDAAGVDATDGGQATGAADDSTAAEPDEDALDLDALDAQDWRDSGPYDLTEIDDLDRTEDPRIDLGAMIVTGVPGSELRLQVAEETQQIVSAMLVIETLVESSVPGEPPQAYSSALELGAYAAPRSGGLWAELRDEICEGATQAGGSAALAEGPFGVEVRRLVPVTAPDGEEGYQPSRMWVAEGPRWLLRGIVYGQAAVEEDDTSAVVADVLAAFRLVVVRRSDEAMAPGDLLPLTMPADAAAAE